MMEASLKSQIYIGEHYNIEIIPRGELFISLLEYYPSLQNKNPKLSIRGYATSCIHIQQRWKVEASISPIHTGKRIIKETVPMSKGLWYLLKEKPSSGTSNLPPKKKVYEQRIRDIEATIKFIGELNQNTLPKRVDKPTKQIHLSLPYSEIKNLESERETLKRLISLDKL